MKTIEDVEKEFEEKFEYYVNNSDESTNYEGIREIQSFISTSLRELLEQVVPTEEEKISCIEGYSNNLDEKIFYDDGFEACRSEVLNNIKKITE